MVLTKECESHWWDLSLPSVSEIIRFTLFPTIRKTQPAAEMHGRPDLSDELC